MIRGIYLNGMKDDWMECLNIRRRVFGDELQREADTDDLDGTAIQVLLYAEDGQPAASARLQFDMNGFFEFNYLCVLPEYRKKGYGDFVMHMLFDKANQCGAHYLVSHDTLHSPDFFKRYGFKVEGDRMLLDLKAYFQTHTCCH